MIPVTYGYARVSKSDRDERNLETQLRELARHGIRQELIFSDVMTGRLMSRPGWDELMARVQPNDTILVVWLDRFSRNFDEGVRIQADLTNRNIGIIAIKEGIDTTDDSAAAKYFRRMMLANGAYQADSTSERIKAGQDRAKAEGETTRASSGAHARPGERVQAHVRGEPIGEPRGQDHEDLVEYGQQGNPRGKVQRQGGRRRLVRTGRFATAPNPALATPRGTPRARTRPTSRGWPASRGRSTAWTAPAGPAK